MKSQQISELACKVKTKDANRYRREIRSAGRGLWSGVLDMDGFIRAMASAVQSGMRRATVEGISECGFSLNELEQSELRQIAGRVTQIQMRIARYGNWIAQNNRASGAKLAPVFARAELWANQYFSIMLFSRSLACGDKKYMWALGATEQHCRTCAALNGKVKRMSYWRENALPRNAPNDSLECGGWRCDCDLVPTDAPLSRGKLPGLM